MKQILKKKGIILKSKDFKENSQIITVLTEEGLTNLILKGTTKMNSGNKKYTIVPVDVDYLFATSNSISTFTEGYVNNNYNEIKIDNVKSLMAMAITEKVLAFCDNIDNKELFFEFVKETFEQLNNTKYPSVILNIFEIKLLYLLGISPILTKCIKCNNQNDLMLSVDLGGTCCKNCQNFNKVDLTKEETEIFKYLYYIKLEKIDEEFLKTIDNLKIDFTKIIDMYYQKYIDFHSKVKKIIEKVS